MVQKLGQDEEQSPTLRSSWQGARKPAGGSSARHREPPKAASAGAVWRRAPPGGRRRARTAPSLAPPPPASAQHGDAQQGGAAADPGHPAGAGGAREAEAGAGGEGWHRGRPGWGPVPASASRIRSRRAARYSAGAVRRLGVRRPEDGCALRGPPAPRPPGRAHPEQGAGAGGGARSRGGGGGLGRWGRGGRMAPGVGASVREPWRGECP